MPRRTCEGKIDRTKIAVRNDRSAPKPLAITTTMDYASLSSSSSSSSFLRRAKGAPTVRLQPDVAMSADGARHKDGDIISPIVGA